MMHTQSNFPHILLEKQFWREMGFGFALGYVCTPYSGTQGWMVFIGSSFGLFISLDKTKTISPEATFLFFIFRAN
jgi:hypothetical protein